MVSQTVDKIIIAEKRAAEQIDSAYQKSEEMIFQANEKAKDIISAAKSAAADEAGLLNQKSRSSIEEIIENNEKISDGEVSELRVKAEAQKQKAMDIVMVMVFKK